MHRVKQTPPTRTFILSRMNMSPPSRNNTSSPVLTHLKQRGGERENQYENGNASSAPNRTHPRKSRRFY